MKPKIASLVCNSPASNTGMLTGRAAVEIVKKYEEVCLLSLPALVNLVSRQIKLVEGIKQLVVVDGCKNSCAMKVADEIGLWYESYANVEENVGIKKLGPFSTHEFSQEEVKVVKEVILAVIKDIKRMEREYDS
ncbi:MAG: hypothetical protein H0Z28_12215 [Archaeoglobus sp.]|nr:hypothetical protein [Archaeoglobus sp.]